MDQLFSSIIEFILEHFFKLLTLGGFVGILVQVYLNNRDVKLTRSINLVSRYFSDYHYLKTLLRDRGPDGKQIGGILPQDIFNNTEQKKEREENYYKLVDFLYELAFYWRKNLVDKQLIKDKLRKEVESDEIIIHELFDKQRIKVKKEQLVLFAEMAREMEFDDYVDYFLDNLYRKMGIIQSSKGY